MVTSRKTDIRIVSPEGKLTFGQFLRHARALGNVLDGIHSHAVEFEPQSNGILGRFHMVHEKDITAEQRRDLEDAASRVGMSGFREFHSPRGGRTGSLTFVFDATDSRGVREAFRREHRNAAKPTRIGMKAEYRPYRR